jgi:threonine 3-dehydrogenase
MAELGMTEGFDVGLEMSGAPPAFRTMLDTMNHGGRIRDAGYSAVGYVHRLDQSHLQGAVYQRDLWREMFETWYKMAALIQSVWICHRSSPTVLALMSSSRALTRCVPASPVKWF